MSLEVICNLQRHPWDKTAVDERGVRVASQGRGSYRNVSDVSRLGCRASVTRFECAAARPNVGGHRERHRRAGGGELMRARHYLVSVT